MSDPQPYSARTTVPHPAFALFDESIRRKCAEAFVAIQDNMDQLKVEVEVVVDGTDVPTCMCPIAYCLFYSGKVQSILVQMPEWTRSYDDEMAIAFLAKDFIFVNASMPDWCSVGVSLDVMSMPTYDDFLPVPDGFGRPVDPEIRKRIRRVPNQSVTIDSPAVAFYDFYAEWDRGAISTLDLVRDWLGIDAIDD